MWLSKTAVSKDIPCTWASLRYTRYTGSDNSYCGLPMNLVDLKNLQKQHTRSTIGPLIARTRACIACRLLPMTAQTLFYMLFHKWLMRSVKAADRTAKVCEALHIHRQLSKPTNVNRCEASNCLPPIPEDVHLTLHLTCRRPFATHGHCIHSWLQSPAHNTNNLKVARKEFDIVMEQASISSCHTQLITVTRQQHYTLSSQPKASCQMMSAWYLWGMANDHMPGTCSLQGCFQLTTDTESVVWCEGLLTVHPVPHDAAGIPADQCFCLRFSVLIPTTGQ